jgi:hypothetical protein
MRLGDLSLQNNDGDEDHTLVDHLEHPRRFRVLTNRLREEEKEV